MSDKPAANDGTSTPFIIALVIIVLAVLGIWLVSALSGSENDDRQGVIRAVLGQNDALQREDFTDFQSYTCAELTETEEKVLTRQRESVGAKGARFVENVTDVNIDGDRASAKVVYYFDNTKDEKVDVAATLVREDGSWRMCTPEPR